MIAASNRRRHERFALPPAYTPVCVRLLSEADYAREGHAYDLSEGGVQFELDDFLAPGTPVVLKIELPNCFGSEEQGREVEVLANVAWADESEPGPVRLAAVFTRFVSSKHHQRLLARLGGAAEKRRAA